MNRQARSGTAQVTAKLGEGLELVSLTNAFSMDKFYCSGAPSGREVRIEAGSNNRPLSAFRRRLVSPARADVADELQADPARVRDLHDIVLATKGSVLNAVNAELAAPLNAASRSAVVREMAPWLMLLALSAYLFELWWRRQPRRELAR